MKSSTESEATNVTKDIQGAVTIGSIDAQNIAVDGSSVSATNNYSVTLAGTAMQNASALNIVNAAGGMVANGINIGRTTNMNSTPTLTQLNNISQSR
jgi:hypothetical protein